MQAHLEILLAWLRAGRAAMLVHVAGVRGSAPREAGAQMLVAEDGIAGTIGGGQLEHEAIGQARALLAAGRAEVADRALGPELGQCCGGAVTLAFEPFAPADLAWVEKLARGAQDPTPLVRDIRFERGGLRRDFATLPEPPAAPYAAGRDGEALVIREHVNVPRPALWLFGAGHVGRACVRALHPLGFAITWIDGRADAFPDDVPPDVRTLSLAMPDLAVDEAPPGAFFLVMTHSHPLDEAICEAVLRRQDFAYLGLIGSKTKRVRFRRRLAENGIERDLLDRMVCPIGLPNLDVKVPAEIAASVAADLLVRRAARQRALDAARHG